MGNCCTPVVNNNEQLGKNEQKPEKMSETTKNDIVLHEEE